MKTGLSPLGCSPVRLTARPQQIEILAAAALVGIRDPDGVTAIQFCVGWHRNAFFVQAKQDLFIDPVQGLLILSI
jgi:hypothetical protein